MSPKDERCRCEEALEQLQEYLDAEMAEIEWARVHAHIVDCAACLEAIGRERELRVILKRSCAEIAPDALRMRVRTQLTLLRASRET